MLHLNPRREQVELHATYLMPTQPDQTAQEMIVYSVRRFITTEREFDIDNFSTSLSCEDFAMVP